jgi:hypothetical protein
MSWVLLRQKQRVFVFGSFQLRSPIHYFRLGVKHVVAHPTSPSAAADWPNRDFCGLSSPLSTSMPSEIPNPSAAELKIYKNDFHSFCTDGALLRENLGKVMEKLLKRPTSEVELRVSVPLRHRALQNRAMNLGCVYRSLEMLSSATASP